MQRFLNVFRARVPARAAVAGVLAPALAALSIGAPQGAPPAAEADAARQPSLEETRLTLAKWIETGAKDDPGPTPAVVAVEILPPEAVLDGPGATQQFTVRARYADGTDRDVTSLTVLSSSNDNAATIDPSDPYPTGFTLTDLWGRNG